MMRRLALAGLVLAAAAPRDAAANGRPPATSSIQFRQGQGADIVAGLTFGVVFSRDGGKTWAWVCEDALGYKGTYDPRLVYTASGAVFATAFDGIKVARDSCTFRLAPSSPAFVSADAVGPNGAIYFAAAQAEDAAHGVAADFAIYKSTDDGVTFPQKTTPTTSVNWWTTIVVAPSNAQRIYLTGYRYMASGGGADVVKQALLYRSDDGAQTWTSLPVTDFTLAANSDLEIVGIASDDPDHVYARVKLEDNQLSDAIYVSANKGATWKRIIGKPASIGAFVVRAAKNAQGKHDLIIGTQALGAEISHDDGVTWSPIAGAPHLNCLVENPAGELWACTQNYGFSSVPSDDAGIMKTTDLVTWTKVLRYQDLTEVVGCAAGSVQKETCAAQWCAVCQQLGCKPAPSYGCPVPMEAPATSGSTSKGGCCDAGASAPGALVLAIATCAFALRPRRRR